MNKKIMIGGCALTAVANVLCADKTTDTKEVSYFNPYVSLKGGYAFLGSREGIKYKGGFEGAVEMGISYDAWRLGVEVAYHQSKIKNVNNGVADTNDNSGAKLSTTWAGANKAIALYHETGADANNYIADLAQLDKVAALSGMINVYYDYALTDMFSIYAGAGIGMANVSFESPEFLQMSGNQLNAKSVDGMKNWLANTTTANVKNALHKKAKKQYSGNVFAWQVMAGIGLEISENWKLTVGYHLFNTAKVKLLEDQKIKTPFSHAVQAGLHYTF